MRRMKKKKDGHVPFEINCGGCGRKLETKKYAGFPPNGTPKEKIHDLIDPTSPYFSVACTSCGHYTRSMPSPWPPK